VDRTINALERRRVRAGVWQRTSPFAIVFFAGRTVRNFARSFIQLVAAFGALAVLIERIPAAVLAIPFGIAAIVAGGVLQYWFFRFRLEEDRILIRQGVFRKTALDLPFDRVQGINVERSPVDRILGLVTVSLDTAGSVAAEGQLPSVSTGLAEWLRTKAGAGGPARSAGAAGDDDGQPAGQVAPAAAGRAGARGEIVLRLAAGDIVRIGMANRNIVLAAAFLGLLSEVLQIGEDAVESAMESAEAAFQAADEIVQTLLVAGFVLSGLALVLAVVIGGAFLRYHDFTLWREGGAFRSRAGLLTQREVVVETAKIQQLTLSQNLLMRLLRGFRLRALPAALLPGQGVEGTGIGRTEVLEVPFLKAPKAEELRSEVFGSEGGSLTLVPQDGGFVRVSPHYVRALTLRISVAAALVSAPLLAPLLAALAGAHFADGAGAPPGEGFPAPSLGGGAAVAAALGVFLWWLVLVPPAALLAWQRWRRQAYLHDRDGLASRSGFFGRKVDAFLFRKAQGVAVNRSPLQRRKGLATLQVQLACGRVAVPYIDHGLACRLRDRVLHRAESSRRRWH